MTLDQIKAREDLVRAVLRLLANEHADEHAHRDAEQEYADDLLVDAARRLTGAAEQDATRASLSELLRGQSRRVTQFRSLLREVGIDPNEPDLSNCPYYREAGICASGCWEEPACVVDEPHGGWPIARIRFALTVVDRVTELINRYPAPGDGTPVPLGEVRKVLHPTKCACRLCKPPTNEEPTA